MPGRSIVVSALFVLTPFILIACDGGDGGTTPPPPPAVTVTFSFPAPTISEGDTISVSAAASGGGSVTYASSNAAIATVSPNGLVTGVGAGSATITATSGSASATLSVTVEALTISMTIDAVTQNGIAVDPSSVSGTIDIDFTAEVPNTFDGEAVIMIGGTEVATEPLNGGSGGGATAASSAARRLIMGRSSVKTDLPISITALDVEALNNGPSNIEIDLASAGNVVASSAPFGVTLDNMNGAFVQIRGIRGVSAVGTEHVAAVGIDGVYVSRDPNDPRVVSDMFIDLEAIQVLRGPQSRLFGKNATGGVVSFDLDKHTDYAAGGTNFGDVTGSYRAATVTVNFTDNTSETPTLLGDPDQYEWNVDTGSPFYAAAPTWNLAAGVINWWGGNVDLDQWGLTVGGDYTNGEIADAGVGLDTCEAYTGPDLSNWTRTLNSDDLSETLTASLRYSYLCNDKLGNQDFIWLNNPMGVDLTAGAYSLSVGPNFLTADLNPNPASGTALGFSGTDAGSGVDLMNMYLGTSMLDASGITYTLGSDDGAGGITPVHVDVPTAGQYTSLDYDATGLFRVGYQFTDKAKNLTALNYLHYVNDDEAPAASNVTASSPLVSGQDATFTWDVTDNLAIRRVWTVADYGAYRMLLDRDIVWNRDDTDLQQTRSGSVTRPWIGSVEGVTGSGANPNIPDGTSWQAMGVWTYTDDLAGNGDDEWIDITPQSSGGRTISFGANGLDWVGFVNWSPTNNEVCAPEPDTDCGNIPTTLPLTVETRYTGTGSSDVTSFQLFAELPFSANPTIKWLMPISARVDATLQDNGTWFQQFGDLEIDMTVDVFNVLNEDYVLDRVPVRVGAFDDDNNALLSEPREIRFHVGFRF